jgi:hopanoid biosynthesis associated protein HpnK
VKRLIVTADDFGLSLEVNEAVELAHRKGILSAASLMVAGPAAADAVRRARRLPTLRVGLHLVLCEGQPVLPRNLVSRLIGADGRLRSDMARLGLAIAVDPEARRQLHYEIEMQYEAFRETGLPLDHVNGHKHYHVHPVIAHYAIAVGGRYGLTGLRVPSEPIEVLRRIEPVPRQPTAMVMAPWARLMRARARRAGLTAPDSVFGLHWSGAMTPERVAGLLRNLPEGVTEIYTHPAVSDRFADAAPGYRYGDELRALISPECVELVSQAGVTVGGYGPEGRQTGGMAA